MNIEPINHHQLLGIRIATEDRQSILEKIKKGLQKFPENGHFSSLHQEKSSLEPYCIVTPNTEQTVVASRNPIFAQILNQADLALPDGIGMVIAARVLKTMDGKQKTEELKISIPGVEFMQDLVGIAAKQGVRIALIGGLPGVALKAFECLKDIYPGVEGWAEEGPAINIVEDRVQKHSSLIALANESSHTSGIDSRVSGSSTDTPSAIATIRDTQALRVTEKDTNTESQPFQFTISDGDVSPTKNVDDWINQIAQKIEETGVGMVFIAYGAPKQEYLSHILKAKLVGHQTESRVIPNSLASTQKRREKVSSSEENVRRSTGDAMTIRRTVILMSVGGSFDMISGRLTRAPHFMRTLGLEWFYRLLQEPWRIKRQFDLVRFIMMVLKKRFFQ